MPRSSDGEPESSGGHATERTDGPRILTQALAESELPPSCRLESVCVELEEHGAAAAPQPGWARGAAEPAQQGRARIRTVVNRQVVLGAEGGGRHVKIRESAESMHGS